MNIEMKVETFIQAKIGGSIMTNIKVMEQMPYLQYQRTLGLLSKDKGYFCNGAI